MTAVDDLRALSAADAELIVWCRNNTDALADLCVNPDHLEPVTQRENLLRSEGAAAQNARKTHCPQGHPYDDENTGTARGKRRCRTCGRESERRRKADA